MIDVISRQEAIATAVRAAIDWHKLANPQYSIAYCIGEAMRDISAADVVEVTRCRDCKHFAQDIMNPDVGVCCHDEWVDRQYSIGFEVDEDGFCYRAELKEAE